MASPANVSQQPLRTGLRTVFLDRDGVLNRKPPEGHYVTRWSDFHLLPGVPQAIARLNRSGLRVLVVSNQRGVALGLYTAEDVSAIHTSLQRELAMVKVRGKGEQRMEALRLADAFRARVIDATNESFVFEITGASDKIESFVNLMLPLGLVEVSRTGVVAIGRGPEGM